MKMLLLPFCLVFGAGLAALTDVLARGTRTTDHEPTSVTCSFSPPGCASVVIAEIGTAKHTIRMQAYGFTSVPIASALVAAHARGVDVQVIMDAKAGQSGNHLVLQQLSAAHIPVLLDAKHAIAHNKVIIIDSAEVLTGSYNFTTAAEKHNAENLVVIHDPEIAQRFTANWTLHQGHSTAPKPTTTP